MKLLLFLVFGIMCLELTFARQDTYKAGVVDKNICNNGDISTGKYESLIREAGKSRVDVLLLPSPIFSSSERVLTSSICGPDNYDEIVKSISNSARDGAVYVVAHLYERTRCKNRDELVRNNLVFNRQGVIVSIYRKLVNTNSDCNMTTTEIGSFTTDFGVKFGVLMEEDLVLQNFGRFKGVKNFVVAGGWSSEIPLLTASQFASSLAYVTNVNLISAFGIHAGRAGVQATPGHDFLVAELEKEGGFGESVLPPVVKPEKLPFSGEDMSQYMIRPLDLEASSHGYSETVCQGKFCCDFYVKTKSAGPKANINYALAVLDGPRHFGHGHIVGTQSCLVLACAGLYKRICSFESRNNTGTFEKVVISGNFTKANSAQFPIILLASESHLSTDQFRFDVEIIKEFNQVTVEVSVSDNLLSFGIFGRVFSEDFVKSKTVYNSEGLTSDIYDYLNSDDLQQFFDYLWIRLRILIFVVSIYILEMM